MKISTLKAIYSTSLLRNASDKDAANFLFALLDMVDVSKNGEVTIKKLIGGYEFTRSDEPKLPDWEDAGTLSAPRTLESDLREDR